MQYLRKELRLDLALIRAIKAEDINNNANIG